MKYLMRILFVGAMFLVSMPHTAIAYEMEVKYFCSQDMELAIYFFNSRTKTWETKWYSFDSSDFGKVYDLTSNGKDLYTRKKIIYYHARLLNNNDEWSLTTSAGIPDGWGKTVDVETPNGTYQFTGFMDSGYDFDLEIFCSRKQSRAEILSCKKAKILTAAKCGYDCRELAQSLGWNAGLTRQCTSKCIGKGIKFPITAIFNNDCNAAVEELELELSVRSAE